MYDPRVGVWLNLDPIGFKAGDANPNRYVGNGPTSATDPSGLDAYFAFPKAVWESGLTVARYDGTDQQDRGMLFNPASGRREPIIEEYGKAFESFAKDHSNEPIDIRKYIKGADKGKQALINILDEVTNHGKDKIDQLWLVDHGRGDGNPERNDDGGGGQQLGDYVLKKEDFASLRPYLASHATIYLIGCNQGNFPLYCQDAATD